MAIVKCITITVKDGVATPSEELYAYLGDGTITVLFQIQEEYYQFGSFRPDNLNVVEDAETQWASVCVLKPDEKVATCTKGTVCDDKIRFEFSKEFINEIGEEGTHQLQIHLFDGPDESSNRLTIPPIPFHILKPICNCGITK